MTARLVVDLSNKSAWLENLPDDEQWAVSGVTRSTVLPIVAAFGYEPAGPWEWTSPPDGFWCPVEPIEGVKELMTGPEHYTEAERLIAGAHAEAKEAVVYGMLLAEAQVHATLALAAVHAMSAACDGESAGLTSTEWRAWNRVAGES